MEANTRQFRFLIGFEEVKKECSFNECRFFSFKLAAQRQEKVRVLCYNDRIDKWDDLGTALPKDIFVDFFGFANTINKEGNGYDHYGKYDSYHSADEVAKYAHSYGPHIINAAKNKIEFDNGVLFLYDFSKKAYHMSKGINESYPKGLAEYNLIY